MSHRRTHPRNDLTQSRTANPTPQDIDKMLQAKYKIHPDEISGIRYQHGVYTRETGDILDFPAFCELYFEQTGDLPELQQAYIEFTQGHSAGGGATARSEPITLPAIDADLAMSTSTTDSVQPSLRSLKDATVVDENSVFKSPVGYVRNRNWFLTYWPKPDENGDYKPYSLPESKIKYSITQLERCPNTNKVHGHMYVEFKTLQSLTTIKKMLADNTVNCQLRIGTQAQAIKYCSKEETRLPNTEPITVGEPGSAGKRSDLNDMARLAMHGYTKFELLSLFKGNAFRHLGMIDRVHRVVLGNDPIENELNYRKAIAEKYHSHRNAKPDVHLLNVHKLHEYNPNGEEITFGARAPVAVKAKVSKMLDRDLQTLNMDEAEILVNNVLAGDAETDAGSESDSEPDAAVEELGPAVP